MLSEIRAEGAREMAEMETRARQIADRRRVQELARGELEARKIVLAAQKEALDVVYSRALGQLAELKENETLLRTLLEANEREWKRGGRIFSKARHERFIRTLVGSRYAGHIDCTGGVVIESADGSRRVDLRYESILREVWDDSVKEVAEILWPSQPSGT